MLDFPSRNIASTSDLVVVAPWKREIIEADDLISPRTRMAVTFRALFQIRKSAREDKEEVYFSDPIERLEQIHSVRIRANADGMLLAVTHDHQWEPYFTALYAKAGPLLDLLLTGCEGYIPTRQWDEQSWKAWIRAREQASDYFYSATALTAADLAGLTQAERLRREEANPLNSDLDLASMASISTTDAVTAARNAAQPNNVHKQALIPISVMYRLTRIYGADISSGPLKEDALTLLLATRSLLENWNTSALPRRLRKPFQQQLDWYEQALPPQPQRSVRANYNRQNVQRGLLSSFDNKIKSYFISHGAILLLRCTNKISALHSLAGIPLSTENGEAPVDGIFRTLAFTWQGMQQLGISRDALEPLGDAFAQGAAARSGMVGDLRSFHSARWPLQTRNWPPKTGGKIAPEVIDIVLVLRTSAQANAPRDPFDTGHPLHAEIQSLACLPGIDLLHVEGTAKADPGNPDKDHFGFTDGISQPIVNATRGEYWDDGIHAGQLMILDEEGGRKSFREGSFLAIRRVEMDAGKFNMMVQAASNSTGLQPDDIRAKLLGRCPNGAPLVTKYAGANDFDFHTDPGGSACPLQSHVRRCNPRDGNAPRIMRRGMSFGPAAGDPSTNPRGTMFMASCADLAAQYETLLLWVNGGNSTRLNSMAADPIAGPPAPGNNRIITLPHNGSVLRFPLNSGGESVARPTWSLYTYVPPIDFLARLKDIIGTPATPASSGSPQRGKAIYGRLMLLSGQPPKIVADAWRTALRDPGAEKTGATDDLWAFVRSRKGGVVRSPIGVLVGTLDLVHQVLADDGSRYSVKGAGGRLSQTVGNIHLGMDAHSNGYLREAPTTNNALSSITEKQAFDNFRASTVTYVQRLLRIGAGDPYVMDLIGEMMEPVTAATFPHWFDLPDGTFVKPGSQQWRPISRSPNFPGHYWSASKDAFIPIPSSEAGRIGRIEGPVLRKAALDYITAKGRLNLTGTVSGAIGRDTTNYPIDDDVARVLTGVMLGAIATTLGNGGRILDTWATTGLLQRLSYDWRAEPNKNAASARALFGPPMEQTMQSRPVPELLWRVVQQDGLQLGGTDLNRDDILILGVDSASSEERARRKSPYVAFGASAIAPKPPHGCPARNMANGMILGWIAGLAETADVRHTGGTFQLEITPP